MSRLCLTVARLAYSAWIGAAALFVVNGIRLATSPQFDSVTRNQIALTRFPPYYVTGATLLTLGWVTLLCAGGDDGLSRRQRRWALMLGAAAGFFMAVDFWYVYQPLVEMITPPTRARPPEFDGLHQMSEWINTLHVGLAAIVAVVINWPARPVVGGE